jgi:predicted TIM-barrel fold metal-dependent hydrolase
MAQLFEPPRPGGGDYHAHVFAANEFHVDNPMYVPDYDATVDGYLSALRQHGLTWGTIVQPSFLGHDNTFMIDAMKSSTTSRRVEMV